MLAAANSADADAILGVAHNELRLTDPNAQHPDHRITMSEIRTGLWMSYVSNALLSLVYSLAIFASLRLFG